MKQKQTKKLPPLDKQALVQAEKNRFAKLQYPKCSEIFFSKVITIVKLAPTFQTRTIAIWKLNNIVYFCLSNPRSSVISDRWKHDTTQDWEYLEKNLNGISTELIEDEVLLRPDIHISATGYLEEGAFRFTKVTGDEEMIEDGREAETVSDLKEKNKKKGLYVKRKKTCGLYHLQLLVRLRLRLLCLCLGPLLCLRLHLRLLFLCLGCPIFGHLLFRLRLVCLCLYLSRLLLCCLLFRLRLVYLYLCLDCWLIRLCRLCLGCLFLCLGHQLVGPYLVCLCLCLGYPLHRFLYGLFRKYQRLFWELKD